MKHAKRYLLLTAAFVVLTTFTGCLEYEIQTVISPDGSCVRTIIIERDSKSLPESAFPLPVDSSWTTEWQDQKKDSSSEGRYRFVASKRFETPELLAHEYAHTGDSATIAVRVTIDKAFRWFHTYFTYRETYGEFNQFTRVPASQVLTEQEIRHLAEGQTNDSLKGRLEEWQQRAMFEDLWFTITEGVPRLDEPGKIAEVLRARKEAIFQASIKDTASSQPTGFLRLLSRETGSNALDRLRPDVEGTFQQIERKMELGTRAQGTYTNSVVMPGVVLDANSTDIQGTKVVWKFDSERLKLQDMVMEAESRVTNVWAFAVTAGGVIGVVVLLLLLRRGRS